MIDVSKILFKICEDENVFNPNYDLIDSGLLDSFAFIELFSVLEDQGIIIQPTRINRELLRTPASIQTLIDEYEKEKK